VKVRRSVSKYFAQQASERQQQLISLESKLIFMLKRDICMPKSQI